MRIAVFSHSSSPGNLGGAERALLELLEAWLKEDAQLEVLVFSRSPEGLLQPRLMNLGVEVHTFPFESWVLPQRITKLEDRYRTLRDNSEFLDSAFNILDDFQPDYVLSNTIVSPWGALTAWRLGVPHIWFVHEFGNGFEFELGKDKTFEDISLLSTHVVASSQALKTYVQNWIPAEKVSVSYPLPAADEWDKRLACVDFSNSTKLQTGELTAVTIGQFSEVKGQKLLLEAAALLQKRGATINVVFVGSFSHEDQEFVDDFILKHQLQGTVRFTGEISEPFEVMREADVGVVTASSEGFGRATVEMMYAGLPIIASAAGATPELFESAQWNQLFEPGNSESLATALSILISEEHRKEKCSVESKQLARGLLSKNHKSIFYNSTIKSINSIKELPTRPPHLFFYWMNELKAAKDYLELVTSNLVEANSIDFKLGTLIAHPVSAYKKRKNAISSFASKIDQINQEIFSLGFENTFDTNSRHEMPTGEENTIRGSGFSVIHPGLQENEGPFWNVMPQEIEILFDLPREIEQELVKLRNEEKSISTSFEKRLGSTILFIPRFFRKILLGNGR